MALEDTDNMDNSPDNNGNGDEQSNRTFRDIDVDDGRFGCVRLDRDRRHLP